jgi:hypothetical protein
VILVAKKICYWEIKVFFFLSNNVVVTETRSDDDIVNSLLNKDTNGENSESDDDPVLNDVPTNADGLLALDTVYVRNI